MITIEHIQNSINETELGISKLTPEFLAIYDKDSCMSSHKVRMLLNNICNFEECNYLEIGSWRGSTFQSAIFNNNITATSIDYWPETKLFRESRNIFLRNLYQMSLLETNDMSKDIRIINCDAFKFNKEGLSNVNVFLYDGDHSFQSQKNALIYYDNVLANEFILCIDDINCEDVWQGTLAGIESLTNWRIQKSWKLPGQQGGWSANSNLYWNGFFIAVINKIK